MINQIRKWVSPKKGVDASSPHSNANLLNFIPETVALEALQSVGRVKKNSFKYYSRPKASSPALDKLEKNWWNQFGGLIENVWSLPEPICRALREPYLGEARKFLKNPSGLSTILEIGCGSGWLGGIIANTETSYVGIDFSKTQIDIAKQNQLKNPDAFRNCSYVCVQDFSEFSEMKDVNGVVMHAFLHHLYGDELDVLFTALRKALPSGSKIFLLEPVYLKKPDMVSDDAVFLARHLLSCGHQAIEAVKQYAIAQGKFDLKTEAYLTQVLAESDRNGYFLSPKEVPFSAEEFESLLLRHTKIVRHYPSGLLDVDAAQMIAFIQDPSLRNQVLSTLLPIVQGIDQNLIDNNLFEIASRERYVFTAYECELLSPVE